jgi:alpha-beta hydrolase superfamily lysophospholipase
MLLGPGLRPQIQPPLLQRLRIALASRLRPDRFFPIPLNEPELFTADPHWQEFIRTHPHDLREATARFLFQSFRFDQFLNRRANRVTVPILLQLAGRDRIIDTGRTRAFLPRLNRAQSITVIDYPEAQHTLEFEPPGHPWERDALDWIERRVLA